MKDTTFIGVYDNVFTKLQCKEIIDYFEQSNGRTIIDNDEAIHHRNDEQLFILDDGNDDDKNYSGDTKIFNLIQKDWVIFYNNQYLLSFIRLLNISDIFKYP